MWYVTNNKDFRRFRESRYGEIKKINRIAEN